MLDIVYFWPIYEGEDLGILGAVILTDGLTLLALEADIALSYEKLHPLPLYTINSNSNFL